LIDAPNPTPAASKSLPSSAVGGSGGHQVLRRCWPVYALILLAMIANSLQGSALSLRLAALGYSAATLGLIMSSAYMGLLIGSRFAAYVIRRWGARASLFTCLALIAACFILLPFVAAWLVLAGLRLAIGVGLAFVYVVVESELNSWATTANRSLVMSLYMAAVFLGMVAGQPLLAVSDTLSPSSFLIASAVVACAAAFVPAFPSPDRIALHKDGKSEPFSWRKLLSLPVVGCFSMGLSQGTFFGIGPAFAHDVGFSKDAVALFMFCGILGGGLMQLPFGRLADAWGRSAVVTICVTVAMVASGVSIYALKAGADPAILTLLISCWGAAAMPVYPLLLAEANEGLTYSQMVAVSGRLIMAFGSGAIAGPVGAAVFIDLFGSGAFYGFLISAGMLLFAAMILRKTARRWKP
jgi:MFS family permease